ncbi:acyloxyacyl hydrolase [Elizabethkingia anophelis]|uniref:acyloxyacyl hydrolase n=1 Tax=Elizabethkingia anophelis TaxID=1117645 RepID=UPI003891F27B
MKKKLMVCGLVIIGFAASAQTKKGNWVVAGSTTLGFDNTSTTLKKGSFSIDGPKVNKFTITPSAGYFVINNLSVGLDLEYTSTATKYDNGKYTTNAFGILPTATYYFTKNKVIKPYLGAGIGYSSITDKEEYRNSTDQNTMDGFAWKLKGGIAYFLKKNIAADLGLSYSQFSSKNNNITTRVNNFGIGIGVSVFFK